MFTFLKETSHYKCQEKLSKLEISIMYHKTNLWVFTFLTQCHTTGDTDGAGTAHLSRAPQLTLSLLGLILPHFEILIFMTRNLFYISHVTL